jgi:hypothetical protein
MPYHRAPNERRAAEEDVMRWDEQGYRANAEVSQAVAAGGMTERDACAELAARTGRDPRSVTLAVRAGVKLFEGSEGYPRHAAGLEREVRRLLAQAN